MKKVLAALLSIFGFNAVAEQSPQPLDNSELEKALIRHETEQSQQSHLNLLLALNKATYIIPSRDDSVKIDEKTGKPKQESKFAFVLSSSPSGKPILPLFTSYHELEKCLTSRSRTRLRSLDSFSRRMLRIYAPPFAAP
jgi:hypothetical protein